MSSFGLSEFDRPQQIPYVYEVNAKTTSLGRYLMARGSVDGTSVRAVEFAVGRGGYDTFDYTIATPVNSEARFLEDPVLSSEPINQYEFPNPECACYYCILEIGEANYALGEIGVWAEIQNSPIGPENGTKFLYAIGHFPLKAKNSDMRMALRVVQQM